MPLKNQSQSTRRTDADTLELYVRSLAPGNCHLQQEGVIQQLNQLEASGVVEEYTVEVWGKQLTPSAADRTEVGQRLSNRVNEFRTWADSHDMSLSSTFPLELVRSEFTGDEYTRIRLPTIALAEYEGDNLQFVSPCSDGETVHTVADHLAAIANTQDAATRPNTEIGEAVNTDDSCRESLAPEDEYDR